MADRETDEYENPTISLAEIAGVLWNGRRIIFASCGICLLLGVLYLHIVRYEYTATLSVTAVQQSESNLASRLGAFSSLTSLAGINLTPGGGSTQFQLYVEALHSQMVADALAKRTDLMKVIFPKQWSDEKHGWVEPRSVTHDIINAVKDVIGIPVSPWKPPDGTALLTYLKREVSIDQDTKKLIVNITYSNKDPKFAVAFLNAVHQTTDNALRQKVLARTTQYIDYLSKTLPTVENTEHRQALIDSLSEQEKNRMMASANTAFAAEPFGATSVPSRPDIPIPSLVLFLAVMLGAVVGASLSFLAALGLLEGIVPRWRIFQVPRHEFGGIIR